jgi:hypothetical protein
MTHSGRFFILARRTECEGMEKVFEEGGDKKTGLQHAKETYGVVVNDNTLEMDERGKI